MLICCSGFLFFACQKIGDQDGNSTRIKTNYVTESEVNNLLKTMSDGMKTKGNLSPAFNTIKSTTPIADSAGTTIYYVVNYEPTGFIIMAADNRVEPILAFSETSNFDVENIADANGLAVWDGMTKSYVQAVRQENEPQTPEQLLAWEPENLSRVVGRSAQPEPDPPTDPDGNTDGNGNGTGGNGGGTGVCNPDKGKTVDLLMTAEWNQICGFNQYTPDYNCLVTEPWMTNNRTPVGCLPLAMGTVMRHHKYPSLYDWSQMNDLVGTPATAYMLYSVGVKMGVTYNCNGTSGKIEKATATLRELGYPLAQYQDYNEQTLIANLDLGYPVILTGYSKIGKVVDNGHAWVCDGYKIDLGCEACRTKTSLYLSMLWGDLDASIDKAWYLSTYLAHKYTIEEGYYYNHNLQMIHSIIPSYNN